MKLLTDEVQKLLLAKSLTCAFLAAIDTFDGMTYFWSGIGTLTFDGHDWRGLGLLGKIEGMGETTEVRTTETNYQLAGITDNPELAKFLDNPVRGRSAKAWFALMDGNFNVVSDPIQIDETILDTASTLVDEQSLTTTLQLNGTSAIFDFRRPKSLPITNEQALADYPDGSDTGFDRIPTEVADKRISWTET